MRLRPQAIYIFIIIIIEYKIKKSNIFNIYWPQPILFIEGAATLLYLPFIKFINNTLLNFLVTI